MCLSDVPTEGKVEPEEESREPNEPSDQNTEPQPYLDPSVHVHESETEPVPVEPVEPEGPAQPVEPLPTATAASSMALPDLGSGLDSAGAILQEEADQPDLQVGGSHQNHKKEVLEEEDDDEEGDREELEGGEALHVNKEGDTCEDQTGLNPQQVDEDQTTDDKQKNNLRFQNILSSRWLRCILAY